MFLWNIFLVFHFYTSFKANNGNEIQFDDIVVFLLNFIINAYIIFLSAKINEHFDKQMEIYSKLKSQVYEILGYAKEYLKD